MFPNPSEGPGVTEGTKKQEKKKQKEQKCLHRDSNSVHDLTDTRLSRYTIPSKTDPKGPGGIDQGDPSGSGVRTRESLETYDDFPGNLRFLWGSRKT